MPKSFPDQLTIEKTPKYFIDQKVPRRLKIMDPAMKLILIVRNPIDRVISDYTQGYRSLINNETIIFLQFFGPYSHNDNLLCDNF